MMIGTNANAMVTLEQLHDARNAYIEDFRITGARDTQKAAQIETQLGLIIEKAESAQRGKALFELATMQRLTGRFDQAIANFQRAADIAAELDNQDLLFDAYLGIARAHIYGTRNHGAAAAAFDRAVASVIDDPSRKQTYEMADYAAQIQASRGELDAALLNALEAIRYAQDDADLFYAYLDTGDALQKFAESCDYRKLIDAKTFEDQDAWGACRRAVAGARKYYIEARKTSQRLGWNFLENETNGFINRLDMRLFLIERKASFEKLGQSDIFKAQDVRDVLVNDDFGAGASALTGSLPLGDLIDEVAPESQANDPRSLYLRGLKADLENRPDQALAYFQKSARMLRQERASLFEPRRRGSVVENRIEIVRDLGLRLLAFNQLDDAFTAFESVRSFGLGTLAATLERAQLSDPQRKSLADLVQLASEVSALQSLVVETTIAGIETRASAKRLERLDVIQGQYRQLLRQPVTQSTIEKLSSVDYVLPTLAEFQEAVRKAGIPVLLFWSTHTNVVVWVITPEGVDVKAVFLPEVALIDKVQKISGSISRRAFDTTSARELHTYLIKPFSDQLGTRQVLIIPQGSLVNLPFEVLVDAESGRFLVETLAVSYAPNAAFALRALEKPAPVVSAITAVYDEDIEVQTQEISRIKRIENLDVEAQPTANMTDEDVIALFGQTKNVHVLLHGRYRTEDPLQSTIKISSKPVPNAKKSEKIITAAELLAIDWQDKGLAVFSSCEGAVVQTRISNESFGISWALLAGGVDHVVLSRWRVNAKSNADWMEAFYTSVTSEGASTALAAAAAMRKMIKDGQGDPFYWAGPQVFGR